MILCAWILGTEQFSASGFQVQHNSLHMDSGNKTMSEDLQKETPRISAEGGHDCCQNLTQKSHATVHLMVDLEQKNIN